MHSDNMDNNNFSERRNRGGPGGGGGRGNGGYRSGGGRGQQICNTFAQKGFCKFGDNCKFSHDQNGPQQQQQQGGGSFNNGPNQQQQGGSRGGGGKGPCKYFMQNGNCKFGDKCQFSHDNSGGGPQQQGGNFGPNQAQGRCQFKFNWGQCDINGPECRHSWNKEENIQLLSHLQDPGSKFVNILKHSEQSVILVAENNITCVELQRNQDSALSLNPLKQYNDFSNDGFIAKYAQLYGDILLVSLKKQNAKLYSILYLNVNTGDKVYIKDAHSNDITGFVLIQQTVLSSSRDNTIKVWNVQNGQFVLDTQSMNQFSIQGIEEFNSIYYHQYQSTNIILAGVKDNQGNAAVAIYSLTGQIKLEKTIQTQVGGFDNTVIKIEKLDDDNFGVIVNHSQGNHQSDYSSLYLIILSGQQGQDSAPIYPQQNNNQQQQKLNTYSDMAITPKFENGQDLIILGTQFKGSFTVLANKISSRDEIKFHGHINPNSRGFVKGITVHTFEYNAIKFFYILVIDSDDNFSIWNFQA